jgi:hypothetical protein
MDTAYPNTLAAAAKPYLIQKIVSETDTADPNTLAAAD